MIKNIKAWRSLEWVSVLTIVAIIAGIIWGISSLGWLPMAFIIAIVIGAAWFYKNGL